MTIMIANIFLSFLFQGQRVCWSSVCILTFNLPNDPMGRLLSSLFSETRVDHLHPCTQCHMATVVELGHDPAIVHCHLLSEPLLSTAFPMNACKVQGLAPGRL